MRKPLGWWLIIKVVLFCLCLIICAPLLLAVPECFISGVYNFVDKIVDDAIRYGITTEEEARKYRL